DVAERGGAALEELVPKALRGGLGVTAARGHAISAAVEVAQHLPSVPEAASAWLGRLEKGEIPVSVRLDGLERHLARFESIPRLIALALVLTGIVIGSALAAAIGTGSSDFRADVRAGALVSYLLATPAAILPASPLP